MKDLVLWYHIDLSIIIQIQNNQRKEKQQNITTTNIHTKKMNDPLTHAYGSLAG